MTLTKSDSLSNSGGISSTRCTRTRLCAPQGLSLDSISWRRLNPSLVPVCVLTMSAPNGPEGAAAQPHMCIIYRVWERDFIPQPDTSYFTTQYLCVRPICLHGTGLTAIWAALAVSWGIVFWHGSWGKWQGCPLSPLPCPLNEALQCNGEQDGNF